MFTLHKEAEVLIPYIILCTAFSLWPNHTQSDVEFSISGVRLVLRKFQFLEHSEFLISDTQPIL